MDVNLEGVREKILQSIDEDELRRIEGWEGLEAFAERVAVHRVELGSIEAAERKWSARGIVTVHLFNWDDERCGEVRLHLIASGHEDGPEICVDNLLISPNMH